jgi:hypothetical protein
MRRVKQSDGVEFKRAGRSGSHVTYRPTRVKEATDATATVAEHKPSVDHETLSAVVLNRDDGSVELQDAKCPIGLAVVKEYQALADQYTVHDLLRATKCVLEELNAVRLRRRGGIYLVPTDAGTEETLAGLQQLIGTIGDSDLYMPGLPKSSEWTRAAARTTMRSLDGMYADIVAEAEGFAKTLASGDLVNSRSLNSRAEAAAKLRRRVELYREVLDTRGDKLADAADVVAKTMREVVEASVDVRALRKTKGSDRLQEEANKLLRDIADRATKALADARAKHAPKVEADDDAE